MTRPAHWLVSAEDGHDCRVCGDPATCCDLHLDSDDDAFYCDKHAAEAPKWRDPACDSARYLRARGVSR